MAGNTGPVLQGRKHAQGGAGFARCSYFPAPLLGSVQVPEDQIPRHWPCPSERREIDRHVTPAAAGGSAGLWKPGSESSHSSRRASGQSQWAQMSGGHVSGVGCVDGRRPGQRREARGRGCRKQAVEPSGEQRQFGGTTQRPQPQHPEDSLNRNRNRLCFLT